MQLSRCAWCFATLNPCVGFASCSLTYLNTLASKETKSALVLNAVKPQDHSDNAWSLRWFSKPPRSKVRTFETEYCEERTSASSPKSFCRHYCLRLFLRGGSYLNHAFRAILYGFCFVASPIVVQSRTKYAPSFRKLAPRISSSTMSLF